MEVDLAQALERQALAFILVLSRIGGIIGFGPIYSSRSLPNSLKFYLAFAMTLMMAPVVTPPEDRVATMIDLVLAMLAEILIGMVLGSFMQLFFQGLQLAGQATGNQLGLALANVLNPQFDEQVSTTSVVYITVASLTFMSLGVDREILAATFETFDVLPLGQAHFHESIPELMLVLFWESMVFSLRVAAPVIVGLFLCELAMAFIARTVPQLNIQSIGFSVRILVGMTIFAASMYAMSQAFHRGLDESLLISYEALANMVQPIKTPP